MRKQTKLVAVLSAAALLAIGASMTSFAATGWQEENGTWVFYDKNGDQVTDTWAKSGDNWYFLGSDGEMTVDTLVEDGDYYYYVNENGAMATNSWVAIDNEDAGNDNEPQQWWYYFQGNGKAMQGPQNNEVSLKTINGKKYAFNNDGKMLYGWIKSDDATIINDDTDAWKNGDYYFGDENDGSMAIGWKSLNVTDENAAEDSQHWINPAFTDDEDQFRFFYFKTNGKKTVGTADKLKESTINGKKYGFDEFGRMVAEWSTATEGSATAGTASNSRNWKYFSDVESGARVSKGWFKVVPPEKLNDGDYNDDSTGWYYADNNGNIYAGELKTINGKKYAFNEKGKMISGLKFMLTEGNTIGKVLGDDNDNYPFDTDENFADNAGKLMYQGYECYYFGDGDDGSMKTGSATIDIDGDKYNFLFGKSGSKKGVGLYGEESKKLYNAGRLVAAGKDEKYQVAVPVINVGNGYVGFEKYEDSNKLIDNLSGFEGIEAYDVRNWSADDDTVKAIMTATGESFDDLKKATGMTGKADKYSDVTIYTDLDKDGKVVLGLDPVFKVINTSGKYSEKNAKNKDGNDIYYKLDNSRLVATYTEG